MCQYVYDNCCAGFRGMALCVSELLFGVYKLDVCVGGWGCRVAAYVCVCVGAVELLCVCVLLCGRGVELMCVCVSCVWGGGGGTGWLSSCCLCVCGCARAVVT